MLRNVKWKVKKEILNMYQKLTDETDIVSVDSYDSDIRGIFWGNEVKNLVEIGS